MSLYSPLILDHYKNPRNRGKLPKFLAKAEELNTSCGDRTTVYINVVNGKITAISHETDGCAVAIAGASILSEKLVAKSPEEISKLTEKDLVKILKVKLTPSRIKCALLPLLALQKALKS